MEAELVGKPYAYIIDAAHNGRIGRRPRRPDGTSTMTTR